jgi:hypothetical protein
MGGEGRRGREGRGRGREGRRRGGIFSPRTLESKSAPMRGQHHRPMTNKHGWPVIFEVSGLVFIYVNESARPAPGSGAAWSAGFAPQAQYITGCKAESSRGLARTSQRSSLQDVLKTSIVSPGGTSRNRTSLASSKTRPVLEGADLGGLGWLSPQNV